MSYHIHDSIAYLKRYLSKFFVKELHGFTHTVKFYLIPGILGAIGIISLIFFISPLPPKVSYIATGQEGSSYESISARLQQQFARNGLSLQLERTSGLGEGLNRLDSDASKISASFLTAGVASSEQYPNLVSLGSIQYAPIWIFYKGEKVQTNDPFEYFSNKKIAIGPANNITNKIFRRLFELNQKKSPSTANFIEVPSKEGVNLFVDGKIDAIFIVDDYNSENIQRILASKNVKIMNFPLADAYIKKLPILQKLPIPKGSINLDSVFPDEDINILASTTNLLIEKDTHPALQWAYLLAMRDIGNNSEAFFYKPGFFPKNLDDNFPLSPIAKRYYANGVPGIFSYLPFWLASLVEGVWAYILGFIIIIYPIYKLLDIVRFFPSEHLMSNMFINLRELDEAVTNTNSKSELEKILATLDNYEKEIYSGWLFDKNARFYFNLKNALAAVRRDAAAKLNSTSNP